MTEMKVEDKQSNRGENPARFQRTDQWRPVYSWLEALDLDEVIKSKDISDWLAANPEVNEELGSRHSRYHLMHYIKKCHMKILKKRNGGLQKPSESASLSVEHPNVPKLPATITSNPLTNVPEHSDLYHVKRLEALRKYEILVEFEKQLSSMIAKQNTAQES
ncbi:uncharacterized protein LOC110724307 isoform X1 [Chenopodium quinoa]|uniref:uncharacterized protein LOC110724307 isoform X1 n=1 Tax=Chenopodium quinoa TaxID=63459 RepID=UPI000B78781E|nr:uncharacterized protein LOC110724307 isoform X1 [Chenopodium quinoa]